MTTYMKKFYFDDDKLRERGLNELVHAFETGRMIAFVGSMATESLGYGGWKDLARDYILAAKKLAIPSGRRDIEHLRCAAAIKAVNEIAQEVDRSPIDRQVTMTIVHEALSFLDEIDPRPDGTSRARDLEAEAAKLFSARGAGTTDRDRLVVRALVEDLRIRRFATLNYDLEIEAALMLEPGDPNPHDPRSALAHLRDTHEITTDPKVPHRLIRLKLSGHSVESDLRDRERPDRLINFAAGSPEIDYGIMHLHGRVLEPHTMIIRLRDYDLLYRKDDPAKVPFAQGQRALFAGNPLLFVGAGMSEPELNTTLQGFVSNSPYRRFAPSFLLWSTSSFSSDPDERRFQIWLKRIDFFRRLGVLTIFDEDLRPDEGTAAAAAAVAASGAWGPAAKAEVEAAAQAFGARAKDDSAAAYGAAWAKTRDDLDTARKRHALLRETKARGSADPWLERQVRELDLTLLARTTSLVGLASSAREQALEDWRGPWRHLGGRFDAVLIKGAGDGLPIALWGTKSPKFAPGIQLDKLLAPTGDGSSTRPKFVHRVVIAPDGSGKGGVSWAIANAKLRKPFDDFQALAHRRLVINAGFALDTDFLLLAISRFLMSRRGMTWEEADRTCREEKLSREVQFESGGAFKVPGGPVLIVVNGMDRFFSGIGAPLSAELDHLLRRIVRDRDGDVRWIFLGGPRIERYFRMLSNSAVFAFDQICCDPPPVLQRQRIKAVYFDRVVRRLRAFARRAGRHGALADRGDLVVLEAHRRGDAGAIARAAVGAYVNAKVLQRAGLTDPALAMEILRAMAFIGTPVEAVVLLHVPRVRSRLIAGGVPDAARLLAALKQLIDVFLVMRVRHFEDYPGDGEGLWQRIGLHAALLGELRRQFGVPISESKLSTSFNMSLFIAQPVDGFVPERAIHEELGHLIDHLIGAYKDEPHPDEERTLRSPPAADGSDRERRRCGPYATATLRAALGVVRGYYSTTSLLTMDRSHRGPREDRDGVLLEHAERLETMLRVYRKLNDARDRQASEGEPGLGPDPFYAEDLVWILNELGVIYLAQGDLYAARRNFDQALKVNGQNVEFRSHSHNWRRVSLNQVLLRIERGGIFDAEALLREIENSVNDRGGKVGGPSRSRFDRIRKRFGEGAPESRSCFDVDTMHEEVLVTALVLGHRAFCHHLRGHLLTAQPLYKEALTMLRRLGENRAYAFFQRHYAQLLGLIDPESRSEDQLRLAVAAAESVRQMDMAYHARINQADAAWRRGGADMGVRRSALRHLTDAASYGALMDLHRIRVEAGIHLATLQLDSGDYEGALDHAIESMSLAARYGMTLRKINLRLVIGQILVRRGDRKSGASMIDCAVEAADRFGYQRAVESAQKIRITEGLAT